MRTYLKISVNLDTGEADFTDSSIAQIDEWTGNNPLFAADILQDIYYSTKCLYDDAVKAMREEYNNLRLSQETQQ